MTLRKASTSAVSGNARMSGCAACGEFDQEKNTPVRTHVGAVIRFINPEAIAMHAVASTCLAYRAVDAMTVRI
jgi:hypothetical protein